MIETCMVHPAPGASTPAPCTCVPQLSLSDTSLNVWIALIIAAVVPTFQIGMEIGLVECLQIGAEIKNPTRIG